MQINLNRKPKHPVSCQLFEERSIDHIRHWPAFVDLDNLWNCQPPAHLWQLKHCEDSNPQLMSWLYSVKYKHQIIKNNYLQDQQEPDWTSRGGNSWRHRGVTNFSMGQDPESHSVGYFNHVQCTVSWLTKTQMNTSTNEEWQPLKQTNKTANHLHFAALYHAQV